MFIPNNLDRFKIDLEKLTELGKKMHISMHCNVRPKDIEKQARDAFGDKAKEYLDALPNFYKDYERWY